LKKEKPEFVSWLSEEKKNVSGMEWIDRKPGKPILNSIIRGNLRLFTGEDNFMIMKRIITDRIIISCFGNRNSMTDGI
jgi:hypothetical protein